MKCIECDCCRKGWFQSKPNAFVCTGVKEPFVIDNPSHECTEYPEKRKQSKSEVSYFIDDNGIHVRQFYHGGNVYKTVISKDMFIEAYSKWIKGEGK